MIAGYKCSKCNDSGTTKAIAVTQIVEMPIMLVIAITKLLKSVDAQIVVKDIQYTVRALYCYSGNGEVGHYYAYVYGTNGWNLCDDMSTRHIANLSPR